jgi:hypothetical protein
MSGFTPVPAGDMSWERNVLGSEVTRLRTDGAMLTIVHSKGCVTYVVAGRIEIDGTVLGPGDAGSYRAPGGFFSVKFLEDASYLVARANDDEITMPDLGERSAHNLDA